MKRTDLAAFAAATLILPAAQASTQSDALASCLHENTTKAERDVFVQWAFVSLGKSSAARQVAVISDAKTRAVESKAQEALTKLVLKKCSKPALQLLLRDPKNGLQDTLQSLAEKLVEEELKRRTTPLLSLTITDILKPGK